MTPRRWMVLGSISVVLVMTCAGLVWHSRWQEATIVDVTQPADLQLQAQLGDGWPMSISGLSISVTGEIDGEAEIFGPGTNGERIAGKVDWRIYTDRFDGLAAFHYRPTNVTAGHLIVRYQFH